MMKKGKKVIETKIKKRERIKITEEIQAEFYQDPYSNYTIDIYKSNGKKKAKVNLYPEVLSDETKITENRKGFVHSIASK